MVCVDIRNSSRTHGRDHDADYKGGGDQGMAVGLDDSSDPRVCRGSVDFPSVAETRNDGGHELGLGFAQRRPRHLYGLGDSGGKGIDDEGHWYCVEFRQPVFPVVRRIGAFETAKKPLRTG